jgi:hypothetical protein
VENSRSPAVDWQSGIQAGEPVVEVPAAPVARPGPMRFDNGGAVVGRRLALAALLLVPLIQLVVLVPVVWTEAVVPRDVTAYVLAADRVRAGEPLYEPLPPGPHVYGMGAPYLYPPFFAAVSALAPLSGVHFARAGLLAGLVCFWIFAACLARLASGRVTPYGVLVWGAALTASFASLGTLYVGQADSLIWALFGIALVSLRMRGFALAASALIKPFAVWPLGLAAWRERRPVVVGAAAAVGLAFGLSALSMGPIGLVAACIEWFTRIYPNLSQGQFDYGPAVSAAQSFGGKVLAYFGSGNLSLGFLPLNLAHALGWTFSGSELPAWARLYLTAIGVAIPAAVLWWTRSRSLEFRYAAVMAAALLSGPIFRATYSPILYTVVAAWLGERRKGS